jgi:HNH endonuclease
MAKWNVAEKNGIWKGGKTIASNGYVLVRVGTEHHLADVRGYAYEHRVVAEKKLGRALTPGEQVHHIDGNIQNNSPENLEVVASLAHHRVKHRTAGKALRMPGEDNPLIECTCGCGQHLAKYDKTGRPRKFISGHNTAERNRHGR